MTCDPSEVLRRVCQSIEHDRLADAAAIISKDYPFTPFSNVGRRYSVLQCMRMFIRDGFIDRYSGTRLVFPGTLRLLSILLPAEFPFQSNWRTDMCHFAFWEIFPTIDHRVPVSRGGDDAEDNWVTTSMVRNAAKANFTVEELGWRMVPPGDLGTWDGLTSWCLRECERRTDFASSDYLRRWTEAARRALTEVNPGIVVEPIR